MLVILASVGAGFVAGILIGAGRTYATMGYGSESLGSIIEGVIRGKPYGW